MRKLGFLFLMVVILENGYCWNALGHLLVAQIAYHHLTDHAKQVYNRYNRALDSVYRKQSLVDSASWLDSLRYQNELWLRKKHYIGLPFSLDGTRLQPPNKINAISAIEEAKKILQTSKKDFDRGFSLRILFHVIGDIHQPLHTVNQYSNTYPQGDKGGNLFRLGKNPIATTLHAYWDKGGGYLLKRGFYSKNQLDKKAIHIEKLWPCKLEKMQLDPQVWAEESHQIAIDKAYQLKARQEPDKKYQSMVMGLTEERIALAGCRLAALLNQIDSSSF
ncbi:MULTISPECIES: S1/P1 nuclease [Legionella]|uniref:3'-nucleotidase/nuclease n=1 Tax=Legionella drozanskii LLAP-1 TaxID=1212489 RepID=A0A0W0TDR9_9GAMM|nr:MULTISPECIES: S1/P1 nuclease [Legionella]KTC93714.1 3'-nucleotidase/nuclease [Legionella drozanskii LLAP-1]PJE12740.1 MAG: nuclease [Legionella sp.]